jgi:hypothetical protein
MFPNSFAIIMKIKVYTFYAVLCSFAFSSPFLKVLEPNEDFTLKVIPLFTVLLLVTFLLVPDNHKYGDLYIYTVKPA